MKKTITNVLNHLTRYGIDLFKVKKSLQGLGFYYSDLKAFKAKMQGNNDFTFGKSYKILDERTASAGTMSGHYFHQDLHVAGRIFANKPSVHLDIGSRIDGFVAHVASFRKIEVMDIREQHSTIQNIAFTQADLMQLPNQLVNKYESISSLHVIEHFGLGRYGDPIDPNGHLKAIENIYMMLQQGGVFYFSVPIGRQRIEFNAHRIFSVDYLIKHLEPKFEIMEFSVVNDAGDFEYNVPFSKEAASNNYNYNFGCGIFELRKR